MSTVEIHDCGPISKLEFDLKPGTVTELVGASGSGKSTTTDIVAFALASDAVRSTLRVTKRDGAKNGLAKVDGVIVKIGARATRAGGTETYALIDDGDGIGVLIDPGIAKASSRNLERIRSLVTMAGVSVATTDIAAFAGAAMTAEEVKKLEKLPAVDQVDRVKLALEERARMHEKSAERIQGQIVEIGTVPENKCEITSDEALKSLTSKSNELSGAEASRAEAERAAGLVDKMVVPDVNALREVVSGTEDSILKAQGEIIVARSKIAALEANITALETSLAGLNTKLTADKSSVEAAVKVSNDKAALAESVKSRVTDEKLESLRGAVRIAEEKYQVSKNDAANDALRQRRALLLSQVEAEVKSGADFRGKAKDVSSLVTSVLNVPGWKVADDLTVMVNYRRGSDGWFPFDELSPGERAVRAITTAIRLKGKPGKIGVVCIDQSDWESLDIDGRNAVVACAAECRVSIVVAHGTLESRCEDCDATCHGTRCEMCGGGVTPVSGGGILVNVLS